MGVQNSAQRIRNNVTAALAAIEAKGVTVPSDANSDDLEALIAEIESGGGGGGGASAGRKDVTFIDYDGTVMHSYTVEEAQALTELPPLPEHEGLICQGWNYDLATIKEYDRPVTIGAMYTTDDGTTRVYITLHEGRTSPMLGVCPNGTVTVDWGDGTTPDTLTGTSTTTAQWTPTHNYAAPGDYVIRLTVNGEMGLMGDSSFGAYLLCFSNEKDNRNYVYGNSIQNVEIGSGVTTIGSYAFYQCYSLTSVTIPNSVTSFGSRAFYRCYSLTSVTIPNSITSIVAYAFAQCYSLTSVTIPNSVTSFGKNAFNNCYSLASVTIPNSVTSIESNAFFSCYSLTSVTIPNSVTSIGNSAFFSCYSLISVTIPNSVTSIESSTFFSCYGVKVYDFTTHTQVPTLASTNAFQNIPADCEIRVPSALYSQWIAATNWSTYASQIVSV